jgi:hypothetical protein
VRGEIVVERQRKDGRPIGVAAVFTSMWVESMAVL